MQTSKTIPEFLCYKYKGVRRIDQIVATSVAFAWKCRKYQNWKEVQNAPDDKQLLLKFADALLDGGNVRLSDYGRISGIFYNVQRWRKDKQELADEPDFLPAWVELDSLLHVVVENPQVAVQKLRKEIPSLKQIPPIAIWELFYGWTLLQMLKAQKVPNLPEIEINEAADKDRKQIANLIHFVYTSVGLTAPSDNSGIHGLITAIYKDLGFPKPQFDYKFSDHDFAHGHEQKTLVIRYVKLSPLQLIKLSEVEGHIDLCINPEHDFVREVMKDEKTKALLETFLSSYTEALQQLPAQRETLEALTSYLGIILRRRFNSKS